jgi:hypothetical protein
MVIMGKGLIAFIQIVQFVILAGYAFLYYSKVQIPYVHDDLTATKGLLIVGAVVCCFGFLVNIGHFNWANAFMIIAGVLGAILLLMLAQFLFDLNIIKFNNYRFLFNCLLAMMLIKWLITTVHQLFFVK